MSIIQNLDQIIPTLIPLNLQEHLSPEKFRESFADLGTVDQGSASVGIWVGRTPWECHEQGDEFLYVLAGEVEITLIEDDQNKRYNLTQDSAFIIPARLWHQSYAEQPVTLLSVLASPHGHVSFAEDPRQGDGLVQISSFFVREETADEISTES